MESDDGRAASEGDVALVVSGEPFRVNCEEVPDEDRPVDKLCDGEGDCEEASVSAGDGPCTIEEVECRSADRNDSEDLGGYGKRITVYFLCQVDERDAR
jgi:hypothetical protein